MDQPNEASQQGGPQDEAQQQGEGKADAPEQSSAPAAAENTAADETASAPAATESAPETAGDAVQQGEGTGDQGDGSDEQSPELTGNLGADLAAVVEHDIVHPAHVHINRLEEYVAHLPVALHNDFRKLVDEIRNAL